MGPAFPQHHFEREPTPSRELVELRAAAYKILNLSLTGETRINLLRYGMPPEVSPTVGDMLEMICASELQLLNRATKQEREQWGGWVARLMALYRQHVQSDEFLSNKNRTIQFVQFFDLPEDITAPRSPLSRSDFDVLSFSSEIGEQLGERVGGYYGSSLGRSFQYELRRCGKFFESIAELAAEVSRKLGEH